MGTFIHQNLVLFAKDSVLIYCICVVPVTVGGRVHILVNTALLAAEPAQPIPEAVVPPAAEMVRLLQQRYAINARARAHSKALLQKQKTAHPVMEAVQSITLTPVQLAVEVRCLPIHIAPIL